MVTGRLTAHAPVGALTKRERAPLVMRGRYPDAERELQIWQEEAGGRSWMRPFRSSLK